MSSVTEKLVSHAASVGRRVRKMSRSLSLWRQGISWFPGHVTRARHEIAERLEHVDLVFEVRDARAPRSTASSQVSSLLANAARGSNRHIIVINKADLVSDRQRAHISRWMAHDEPGVPVFFTSVKQPDRHLHLVRQLILSALDTVQQRAPRLFSPKASIVAGAQSRAAREITERAAAAAGHQSWGHDVTSLPLIMMVVGVPNVGKSSLINAARHLAVADAVAARATEQRFDHGRVSTAGSSHGQPPRSRKPARTGALPGVTQNLSGFQVSSRPSAWCLDTPGVLLPTIEGGWEAALRLGALDLLKYPPDTAEGVASYVLHYLSRVNPSELQRWPSAAALVDAGLPTTLEELPSTRGDALLGEAGVNENLACVNERFAMLLLREVAADMGHGGDTMRAALDVLQRLRKARMGPVCFDTLPLLSYPPAMRPARQRPKAQSL